MLIASVRIPGPDSKFYLGTLEFSASGEAQPYSRESLYYPTEAWLHRDYPNSMSMDEAFNRGELRTFLRHKRA